ncbi:TetR/AcrR family transcriptional regulator [Cuniculiplasma sp. SKW3]|uniref:TetR/AcrR family transcriptional regulator n=1 Tax=unclassified Cuniculiplasma TaxID=2619706 RepID=UPI003FD09A05
MPKVLKEYKELARNKIINAAAEVFYYEGFNRGNMEEIAKKVGVTKGTLYLYFKSKEDLLIETCKITQSFLESAMTSSDYNNIEELAKNFMEQELSLPEHIRFFWIKALGEIDRNENIKRILMDEHDKYINLVKRLIMELLRNDERLKTRDIDILSEILVSLHNGLMVSIMQGIEVDFAKNTFFEALQFLIRGN